MRVAFLFDNDGVLIDSFQIHWESWMMLMQKEPELNISYDQFLHSFGKRNDLILKEFFPSLDEKTRMALAEKKENFFRSCAKEKIELLPGMEKFLQEVVREKIPHIIASSTPVKNLQMFLSSTVLGKYFDHYVSGEEVATGKPAPDVFIAAANRLGFDPKDCIVFEDAPVGIEAGKAAGSFVVALETTHDRSKLYSYDMVYPSPVELNCKEILEAFARWKKSDKSS